MEDGEKSVESRQWSGKRRAVGAVGALGWRVPAGVPGLTRCRPRPDGVGGAGGTDRVSLFPPPGAGEAGVAVGIAAPESP